MVGSRNAPMSSLLFNKLSQKAQTHQKQQTNEYFEEIMKLFANFKRDFESFASKNLDKIEKNMELRQDFNQLCFDLNIDALGSSSSIFSKLVRDYYNRLAIKLLSHFELQKCSHIVVSDYLTEFNRKQPKQNHINKKDLEQAIKVMNQLSPGFKMVKQGGTDLIVFMDAEREKLHNNVQNIINQCLQANTVVINRKTVKQMLSCDDIVAKQTIESMVNQRIVAVDNQGGGGWQDPDYYIISVFEYAKH